MITARLYLIQIEDQDTWLTEGSTWSAPAAMRWLTVLQSGGLNARAAAIDLPAHLVAEQATALHPVPHPGPDPVDQATDPAGASRPEPLGRLHATHHEPQRSDPATDPHIRLADPTPPHQGTDLEPGTETP